MIQKLKNLGIRNRGTAAPRTRWAHDFSLLTRLFKTVTNQILPEFSPPPPPRTNGTILECCLQRKACLWRRFRIFQTMAITVPVPLWKLNKFWILSHLNHPMASLVSQQIFYKDSMTIPELPQKRCVKLSNLDGQVDVKSRLYVGGGNVRKQKQNGSRDGCN